VPYEGLPANQQVKDKLFIGVVDALRELVEKPEASSFPA
jgi:hypothetical protein